MPRIRNFHVPRRRQGGWLWRKLKLFNFLKHGLKNRDRSNIYKNYILYYIFFIMKKNNNKSSSIFIQIIRILWVHFCLYVSNLRMWIYTLVLYHTNFITELISVFSCENLWFFFQTSFHTWGYLYDIYVNERPNIYIEINFEIDIHIWGIQK